MQSLRDAGIVNTPIPEPKYPPVDVYPDLAWVLAAFWRLSAMRPQGMDGPLRIPVSEIAAFGAIHRLERTKAVEFLNFIDAMDQAYFQFLREQREEEEGKRSARNAPTAAKKTPLKRTQ